MLNLIAILACAPTATTPAGIAMYGDPSQLALTGADFVMQARNGIDAQIFDSYNGPNSANYLSLYDGSWGSTVSLNQYKILVAVNANGVIDEVRPYGSSASISIPSGGFVVAANGTALPRLSGLEVDDMLFIKATADCTPRADAGVPALVYHNIASAADLEAHLQAIDAAGYNTISLDTLQWYLEGAVDDCEHVMPENPILLTFDDAYTNQFSYAPALLDEYGMTAVFFVITSYPGSQSWVASWTAIADAVSSYPDNVELACHSHAAHSQVGGVARYMTWTETQQYNDMVTCHDKLLEKTGVDTTTIAWPYGSYDEALIETARDAGYEMAMNTWLGINHDGNDDPTGEVRRIGGNTSSTWTSHETAMDRWYVCE